MSELADQGAPPRSVILGRDLPADPRALAATSLADFEAIARERMHPGAFDYVAGGAWDEISLDENLAAWHRYRFRTRVLVDGIHPAFGRKGRVLRGQDPLYGTPRLVDLTRAHLASARL